jgi:cobyric acid synthase CobQ
MPARTVMIQGTGSDVGKSVLVAALCRLFTRQGRRVAPFKAQNMSNNSFATPDGKEIGRAQAVQAKACRIPARADFNPVLIKPSGECEAQLVVNGKVAGSLMASDFGRVRRECVGVVQDAFTRLADEFDLIILEGAGSPAEVNLRDYDIVNMYMAHFARAPVVLVGDIDRGGVLAALVGTMTLLSSEDAQLIQGFLINKFRGDVGLLMPGIRIVEDRIAVPCLGVIPFCRDLRLPEEDAVPWGALSRTKEPVPGLLRIGIAELPCISNSTDFDMLAVEPDVQIVRISQTVDLPLDALIFPGTKNTPQALRYVQDRGMDRLARRVLDQGGTVVGLCGGYQILGRRILDPHKIESSETELQGLGLLDAETVFANEKITVQVKGVHLETGILIEGYEVHMGRTVLGQGTVSVFEVTGPQDSVSRPEGASSPEGRVFGTYIHGIFDSSLFRRSFLNRLRVTRGWAPLQPSSGTPDEELDRWADFVADFLDLATLERIIQRGIMTP